MGSGATGTWRRAGRSLRRVQHLERCPLPFKSKCYDTNFGQWTQTLVWRVGGWQDGGLMMLEAALVNAEILLEDAGELLLWRDFLAPERAWRLFEILHAGLDWEQEHYTLYGRRVAAPRLSAWYGDPGAVYAYSGLVHRPRSWPEPMQELKMAVEDCTGREFNGVLANLYRDGGDGMGWHADDEPELGENPVIASLSLGAERVFRVRKGKRGKSIDILLPCGSLLLMEGAFQHHWQHCLPKTRRVTAPRINLTFRRIVRLQND